MRIQGLMEYSEQVERLVNSKIEAFPNPAQLKPFLGIIDSKSLVKMSFYPSTAIIRTHCGRVGEQRVLSITRPLIADSRLGNQLQPKSAEQS